MIKSKNNVWKKVHTTVFNLYLNEFYTKLNNTGDNFDRM